MDKDLRHAERRVERGYPDSRTRCGEMPCHHGGKRSAVYAGNRRRDAENAFERNGMTWFRYDMNSQPFDVVGEPWYGA